MTRSVQPLRVVAGNLMAHPFGNPARAAVAASLPYMKMLKQSFPASFASRLPAGLTQKDFNFLDPTARLAKRDIILLSASQFMATPSTAYLNPIAETDATVFGDNGAFRTISDRTYYSGPQTAITVLRWMERHCHVGAILDIPTLAIGKTGQFASFDDALKTTLLNAATMIEHRDPTSKMLLLNVMQGRTMEEFKKWYAAVKRLDLDGWAIGGHCRLDFGALFWFLAQLKQDGLIDRVRWIHVFGSFRLELALGLTAFKSVLDEAAGRNIEVTYDASTPMTLAYEQFQIYRESKKKGDRLPLLTSVLPTSAAYAGGDEPFPASNSDVSKQFTLGAVCIKRGLFESTYAWDELSRMIAVNHNLDFLYSTIDQLHRDAQLEWADARAHVPDWILDLPNQGREIVRSKSPDKLIRAKRSHLSKIASEGED